MNALLYNKKLKIGRFKKKEDIADLYNVLHMQFNLFDLNTNANAMYNNQSCRKSGQCRAEELLLLEVNRLG
jgi:hypothetical protein